MYKTSELWIWVSRAQILLAGFSMTRFCVRITNVAGFKSCCCVDWFSPHFLVSSHFFLVIYIHVAEIQCWLQAVSVSLALSWSFAYYFVQFNTDPVKWAISEFHFYYSFFIRCFNYHFCCLKPFDTKIQFVSLCSTVWQECDWFSCWIPPFWLCDVQYALFDVWNTVAFLPNLM